MPALRPVDENCLFCKIIAGTIPCAKVYEDDAVLAFLDINPTAPGHSLVLPKGHYPTLLEVPASEGQALLNAMRLVARAVKEECRADGFNCIQNNFSAAGQMVFHSHWHIIPRYEADGLPDWPSKPYDNPQSMENLARAIRGRI